MNDNFSPTPSEPPETFDALRQRIRERFQLLSPHLKRIAQFSLEDPNRFALSTTSVIAGRVGVQPSTLIRFAKEFGYRGFSDLQKVFQQRLIEGEATVRDRVMLHATDSQKQDAKSLLNDIAEAHRASLDSLSGIDPDALGNAVHLLRGAHHVYVAGLRRSRPIADYFHYGLLRSERPSTVLDFGGGMGGPQIATLGSDDVLFAIAFPPYSQPVVDAVLDAHVARRTVVTLTDTPESPLAKHSNVSLLLAPDSQIRFQPISSAIIVVQTLVTAISQPRRV